MNSDQDINLIFFINLNMKWAADFCNVIHFTKYLHLFKKRTYVLWLSLIKTVHRSLTALFLHLSKNSLTLQRGVTGTARMLHALTHSSISRQVREQM